MVAVSPAHAGAMLEIDLAAVRSNYRLLRRRLGGASCGAVVKADAYGLGAEQVAPALAGEGCRRFFVAHLDEAIALRPLLPQAEIFVLNGLPAGAEADCAAHGVTPVLNSLGQVDAWSSLARRIERPLAAALQVDSGMSRLGLAEAELAAIEAAPQRLSGITLRLVMSHLACAERQADPMNAEQLARFQAARRRLPEGPASLANSSGIFLGTAFHFDLARPGVALYGVNPVPGRPNPMRPVVRLSARIVQIREVAAGDAVGYGARWRAAGPRRIATVSVGYADGYLRALSNHARAFAGDVAVSQVGAVSMDTATFDVTDAPQAAEGDVLELIGPNNPVDLVAGQAGAIGYEILTSLGRRYARAYTDAPKIERLSA